jgi:hypothetical protein
MEVVGEPEPMEEDMLDFAYEVQSSPASAAGWCTRGYSGGIARPRTAGRGHPRGADPHLPESRRSRRGRTSGTRSLPSRIGGMKLEPDEPVAWRPFLEPWCVYDLSCGRVIQC